MTLLDQTPLAPMPAPPGFAGIGSRSVRPDAVPKVSGNFAYASDLNVAGMLWGHTLRSPHAAAVITSIDVSAAAALDGVHAVLLAADVPGVNRCGLAVADQPVLAEGEVRYQGEPVALVAADHPEIARRAAALIRVVYAKVAPVTDSGVAIAGAARALHETAADNVTRHVRIRKGDVDGARAQADVIVSGDYTIGMQDQAFLGPEAGLAVPDGDGGVDLYVATQWLHADLDQLVVCLGLPAERVRVSLAGVGGAFGGREDLSVQAHLCMLALRTGRPVKMMYSREESFFGHVHRHPAKLHYEHGATRDGRLVFVAVHVVFDGGAYTSSSHAVASNAAAFSVGPYRVANATVDSIVAFTNNPPCGAMRGFGSVQTCFAYESQMDKLAAALDMDPVALRILNALEEGDTIVTGQVVRGPAPVRQLLETVRDMPAPDPLSVGADLRELPGGVANTTHGEGVRRGTGYAIGFKNVCFEEGFDDHATARVRLCVDPDGEIACEVHTAAADVGQGLVTIGLQIALSELGVARVRALPADTRVGSAGSSSASRQTYMTGGALQLTCSAVRHRVIDAAALRLGVGATALRLSEGAVHCDDGRVLPLHDILDHGSIEETRIYRHRPTHPLDLTTGQGDAHVQFAFAAHRATVDVDVDLGLVRVVEMATAQDVGRALNPTAVEGQIEGGIAQGLGLALMEEIQVTDGLVRNPSFTDYLIPTTLDMPPVNMRIFEYADPDAPYGVRGVGEPPCISATPAIVNALRAATGRALTRVPVRPDDICFS